MNDMAPPIKESDSTSSWTFEPLGVVESCYTDSFGIPRQPGLAPSAFARIRMFSPFNDPNAFEGLNEVSHLWIQFVFHKQKSKRTWSPKVRPPRLGGNKSMGVFATRSPNRPNPIGLSVVKFEGIEQENKNLFIKVSGVDILNGAPVLDIKPYVPYADHRPEANNGIAGIAPPLMKVAFAAYALEQMDQLKIKQLERFKALVSETLANDPRPQYLVSDSGREYVMELMGLELRWCYLRGSAKQESILVSEVVKA